MTPRWVVIFTQDHDAPRILPYEREIDAVAMYNRLDQQWTGILLCEIKRDGSLSANEQPHPLSAIDPSKHLLRDYLSEIDAAEKGSW